MSSSILSIMFFTRNHQRLIASRNLLMFYTKLDKNLVDGDGAPLSSPQWADLKYISGVSAAVSGLPRPFWCLENIGRLQ